jgi:hypothetical protein
MIGDAYSVAGSPSLTPYRPAYWFGCSATLDIEGSDGIKETGLGYVVTLFTNYDVSTSCSSSIGSAQDGSGSRYYPSVVLGAMEGGCLSAADYLPTDGTAGYWDFSLPLDPGPLATYRDKAGHPLNGRTVVFTEEDCTVMKLGRDAKWQTITLASALAQ